MKYKKDKDEAFKKAIRQLPCILCGSAPPNTVSHIKTRGSGGGDDAWNCCSMCHDCHRFWEDHKQECIYKHPHFAEYLTKLGWEWYTYKNKFYLRHPQARQD